MYLHVIPDFKFLDLPTLPLDELLHQETSNRVGGITLLGVGLDDNSLVHLRPVFGLVLVFIIGVDRVTHITGNQERARDGLSVR
jgi:hypothetical protein